MQAAHGIHGSRARAVARRTGIPACAATATLALLLGACDGSASNDDFGAGLDEAGSGGRAGAPEIPMGGMSIAMGGAFTQPSAGATSSAAGQGSMSASGGAASTAGAAGAGSTSGGVAGTTSSGGAAAAQGGSGPPHKRDHCRYGYDPHPTDDMPNMNDGPAEYYPPGKNDPGIVDLTVQPQVLEWMTENKWQGAHIEWHAIRGCNIGKGGLSKVDICRFTQLIPTDQNCQTGGDGYQFLLFHRHMIQALKQLWPKHSEQFTGFPRFPRGPEDVPPQWRSAWKSWSNAELEAGIIGDEIEKPENFARFKNEGELGFWLQCLTNQKLPGATNMPWVGLHGALHGHWVRPGNTRHGVGNTDANINNYMFWKLHGWIDNVWEKYRRAAQAPTQRSTDEQFKADLEAQCREMDIEIEIIKNNLDPDDVVNPNEPLPAESGYFHEKVRPILEDPKNLCGGCHAETGANGGVSLAGHITSKKIVEGLVNVASLGGGQFKRVVPGDPDRSWLYLKAAGTAASAGCTPSANAQCLTGVMPQTSDGSPTLTPEELQILRTWIADGASAPP